MTAFIQTSTPCMQSIVITPCLVSLVYVNNNNNSNNSNDDDDDDDDDDNHNTVCGADSTVLSVTCQWLLNVDIILYFIWLVYVECCMKLRAYSLFLQKQLNMHLIKKALPL